jgi:hypothetical protein
MVGESAGILISIGMIPSMAKLTAGGKHLAQIGEVTDIRMRGSDEG